MSCTTASSSQKRNVHLLVLTEGYTTFSQVKPPLILYRNSTNLPKLLTYWPTPSVHSALLMKLKVRHHNVPSPMNACKWKQEIPDLATCHTIKGLRWFRLIELNEYAREEQQQRAAAVEVPSFAAKDWLSAITFLSSGLYRVPSGKMTRYIWGKKEKYQETKEGLEDAKHSFHYFLLANSTLASVRVLTGAPHSVWVKSFFFIAFSLNFLLLFT